jgi:hypothetical protein
MSRFPARRWIPKVDVWALYRRKPELPEGGVCWLSCTAILSGRGTGSQLDLASKMIVMTFELKPQNTACGVQGRYMFLSALSYLKLSAPYAMPPQQYLVDTAGAILIGLVFSAVCVPVWRAAVETIPRPCSLSRLSVPSISE